jgi:hypothetical protein
MVFSGATSPIKMTINLKALNPNHLKFDIPGFGEIREGVDDKRA